MERSQRIEVLTPPQLAALNQAKVMIRMDNEQYLREHPDVNKVLRALVKAMIRERPANPTTFAFRFFSRSQAAIRADVDARD